MPMKLTLVANALAVNVSKELRERKWRRAAYIMNGMMAIDIHPVRVASGGLYPIAELGQ